MSNDLNRVARLAALAWLLLLNPLGATAQEEASDVDETEVPTVPVAIDGRILFRVRGIPSLPAAERAAGIEARIVDAAREESLDPAAVTIVPGKFGPEIRAGDQRLMAVHSADSRLEMVEAAVLAEAHRARIESAIRGYRHERSTGYLARNALASAGFTALLAAAIVLLAWLHGRLDAVIARAYTARVEAMRQKLGSDVMESAPLLTAMRGSLRTTELVLGAILVLVWADLVLTRFPWTRWIGDNLTNFLLTPLATIGEGVIDYIPKFLFLVVLALITRFGLRMLRLYFGALERGTVQLRQFDPAWSLPTYKIVRTLVLILALVMAYPYLPGAGTEALRGISVFAGLLVSLGASSAVSNVIAGYLTTFGRVLRVGDTIKAGDIIGVVTQVRLLTTRVRTIRNEEVTIPNSVIMTSSVVNFSALARERSLVIQTEVGIGYEVPWRQVHAMLLEAARRTPDLLRDPVPFVWQRELGDFAVVYQLNVHKESAERMIATRSDLHQHILDVFNEYGVQIMTPAYEGDPETPKVVAKDHFYDPPARPPGDQRSAS